MGLKAGFNDDNLFDIESIDMDNLSASPDRPDSSHEKIYIKDNHLRRIGNLTREVDIEQLRVSSVDTTDGYLYDKVQAGVGITVTKANPGAAEKLKLDVNNQVGSSRLCASCGYAGNAGGKYLEWFQNAPGNLSPLVISEPGVIRSFAVSYKTASTVTFSIRKNGVEIDTLTVTSNNRGFKAVTAPEVYPGDEIVVFVASGAPTDVFFVISILIYI